MRNIIFSSILALALGQVCSYAQRTTNGERLLRYDTPTSFFRFGEDVLAFPPIATSTQRQLVIRVCSDAPMPIAIMQSALNPKEVTRFLASKFGYDEHRILLERSDKCYVKNGSVAPIEFWSVGAFRPSPDAEVYPADRVDYGSIGFDPSECTLHNERRTIEQLISTMKSQPGIYARVTGYYLKSPSRELARNLAAARKLLLKSGVHPDRYRVDVQRWHFGDSACAQSEPTQPSVQFAYIK